MISSNKTKLGDNEWALVFGFFYFYLLWAMDEQIDYVGLGVENWEKGGSMSVEI